MISFLRICANITKAGYIPIHFTGSIAFGFKDVIKSLCNSYEMEMGNIIKQPIDGLIQYHYK